MKSAGKALADAVGEIFGIDPTLIFSAEIDAFEARIVRGVHDSDRRCAITRLPDGSVDAVRVLEVFDMRGPRAADR